MSTDSLSCVSFSTDTLTITASLADPATYTVVVTGQEVSTTELYSATTSFTITIEEKVIEASSNTALETSKDSTTDELESSDATQDQSGTESGETLNSSEITAEVLEITGDGEMTVEFSVPVTTSFVEDFRIEVDGIVVDFTVISVDDAIAKLLLMFPDDLDLANKLLSMNATLRYRLGESFTNLNAADVKAVRQLASVAAETA